MSELVVFKSRDGQVELDVTLENESLWLPLDQIADLFERDKSVISRHLNKVFKDGELNREATVAKNATVQKEGNRSVTRQIEYYNLDAIISVGYRVNSQRGTDFRIWATRILNDYIVKGYAANQGRLAELRKALTLATDTTRRVELQGGEAALLLQVVSDYAHALELLDDYDHQRVTLSRDLRKEDASAVTHDEVMELVNVMRSTYGDSDVFALEKDESLDSSLNTIMQSFGGEDLYPSLEEKAANLLYFLAKNHSFVDGNKRIAAAVFLRFAEKNGLLYGSDGTKRISDEALVAITLMIAESKPEEKDIVTTMVTNLIANNGDSDSE